MSEPSNDNRVTDSAAAVTSGKSRNATLREEIDAAVEAHALQLQDPAYRAWRESIEETFSGRIKTDEERLDQHRRSLMRDALVECPRCERTIDTGDVVHRRRESSDRGDSLVQSYGWELGCYCEACVAEWHPSWLEHRRKPQPCAGGCGALISFWSLETIRTCSKRCAAIVERQRRQVVHEPRSCEGCGEEFVPSRSDARFHSNACRQRAYRERGKA